MQGNIIFCHMLETSWIADFYSVREINVQVIGECSIRVTRVKDLVQITELLYFYIKCPRN